MRKGNLDKAITVILPARNAAKWLPEALESLRGQTLREWACLCLDDGSTDGTGEILRNVAGNDRRFVVIPNDSPSGLPAALNRLLAKVRTPWFARMDADDLCAPDRFERQLNAALAAPWVDLWGSLVAPLGNPTPGWVQYMEWLNSVASAEEIDASAYTDSVLPHPTWFGKTEVVRSAGGYREGRFPEDYELFLRLRHSCATFGKVGAPLLCWRDHPDRLTRTHPAYEADTTLRMKAHWFAREYSETKRWRDKPVWIRGAGRTGRTLADELAAVGMKIAGFSDPLKAGAAIMNLPVVEPWRVERSGNLILAAARPKHLKTAVESELKALNLVLGADYLIMA